MCGFFVWFFIINMIKQLELVYNLCTSIKDVINLFYKNKISVSVLTMESNPQDY